MCPRKATTPAAWPGSGAATSARWTTARSATSWPTPPVAARPCCQGRLYLPEQRAADTVHRTQTHVPKDVVFQKGWRIALDLIRTQGKELPHGWVVGDDEFSRATEFRAGLRFARERYVLDVPCNTLVRDLSAPRPPSRPGGRPRLPVFERADVWATRQPKGRWRKLRVRDGEKGPLAVRACQQWVQTKDEGGLVGPRERLVVIRTCEKKPRTWYTLSNARDEKPLAEVVQRHGDRHGIEELFEQGNGEVGLNHCEVRSWVGWQHHVTLTLLALWFLQTERLRVGKKNPPVTVPQVRQMFAELLHPRPASATEVAEKVSEVLRCNEEARIYHWYRRYRPVPTTAATTRAGTASSALTEIISHSRTTLLRASPVVQGDETGWRINGKPAWAWCFRDPRLAIFLIDRHRRRDVIARVLGTSFAGTVVSDFYAAYNGLGGARQRCLVHLLRELAQLREELPWPSVRAFIQPLLDLFQDALALGKEREQLRPPAFSQAHQAILDRFDELLLKSRSSHPDCLRIWRRLFKHCDELFTFLRDPRVPADNNGSARDIRSLAAAE